VRELLVRARARIEDPARWCQGDNALDANGAVVASAGTEACRWCADGAVIAEAGGPYGLCGPASGRLRLAAFDLYAMDHIDANDGNGHAAALAIYDRAINKTLDEEAALAGMSA
jgi:hypothetical protein